MILAVKAEKSGLAGIVLNVGQSARDGVEESIRALRSVHPKLKFPGPGEPAVNSHR
jgi:hypothetical protein